MRNSSSFTLATSHIWTAFLTSAVVLSACSSSPSSTVSGTGGSSNAGGSQAASGGVTGKGGASASGGGSGTGGISDNGGASGTGGQGGATTGGATVLGGTGGTGGVKTGTGGAGTGGTGVAGAAGSGGVAGAGGDMPLVYDTEDTGADCAKPTNPAFSALTSVANLPDPFLMTSGTRISSREQWRCRRAEIAFQIQYWGTGSKGAPPSSLTATYSGGKLTVVATQGSASITLSSTISTPAGSGPFPVLIQMAGSGVPTNIFTSRGVATMSFDPSSLTPTPSAVTRGAGTYFTMYPDTNTGAMIEWAWGVSRIIDGLYKTADQNKIDLKHIAVSGCSYAGKMALYAAAFDERIALAIPEESGGGGEASWRAMATESGTESLNVAQGTAWYAENLLQFKNPDAPKLPYDQHELVAMVAPRAILEITNTAITRISAEAGYVSMKAASEVYKALGIPDRIGYSQAGATSHCAFPSSQSPDVAAFVDKFLLGKTSTETGIAKTPYNTDLTKWITWTTPTLK